MKKILISLVVVLGLGFSQMNAQGLSFGVKADANMSNFIVSDYPGVESNMGFGASLGGFMKADITEHFAIQPELLFHFKSSETEIGRIKYDYQYWGAEIPIYAMGQWNLGNNSRIYAGVGPYVGIGFSAKYKLDDNDTDLYEELGNSDESTLQRWDFGFGATVGYEFNFGLQINAGYKIGVINALDAGRDDSSMLPSTISLGLAYRF